MTEFLDRRQYEKKKHVINRYRFINRYKSTIKKAVAESVNNRSITDIHSGERITIPTKDVDEPGISFGDGGMVDQVMAGNQEFSEGDHIKRPPKVIQGKGERASNTGEGIDDFTFELNRDEFIEFFFDDLTLPELVKKQLGPIKEISSVRSGVTREGVPANLNIVKTLKQSIGRRKIAKKQYRTKIEKLEETIEKTQATLSENGESRDSLKEELERLKGKSSSIPFLDTIDLRYNYRVQQAKPTTKAVMFCLMDVSGSMDKTKKEMAKQFFILLYLFLNRNYEKIDIVYIRHHTSAKEVTEEEFFYSRETGGTVVSTALETMVQIIKERYSSSEWNTYGAQASDGDNWNADSPYCRQLLSDQIMPLVRFYAYVEILPRHHQSLWEFYQSVAKSSPNFSMQQINQASEIYPVFRELFKRDSV